MNRHFFILIAKLVAVAEKSLEGNSLVRYEIDFPEEQRTLRIYFEKSFPYRIQKWEESYRGLADPDVRVKTTRAVRTHTIMDAYWRHHGNKDRKLLTLENSRLKVEKEKLR